MEIHGERRLVAFKTTGIMRAAQTITSVEECGRTAALDKYGQQIVAKAELEALDIDDVTRVIGLPAVGGKVSVMRNQYLTMQELADLTGVKKNLIHQRKGWPEGTVIVQGKLVPVSTETILWAKEGIRGTLDTPGVIR